MSLIFEPLDNHNGIVGHIKAYLTSKKKSAMISTTGDGCNVIEYDTDFTLADVTVIVLGVDEQELCHEIIWGRFAGILNLPTLNGKLNITDHPA